MKCLRSSSVRRWRRLRWRRFTPRGSTTAGRWWSRSCAGRPQVGAQGPGGALRHRRTRRTVLAGGAAAAPQGGGAGVRGDSLQGAGPDARSRQRGPAQAKFRRFRHALCAGRVLELLPVQRADHGAHCRRAHQRRGGTEVPGDQHTASGRKWRRDILHSGIYPQFLSRGHASREHLRRCNGPGSPSLRGRRLRHRGAP